MSKKSNRRARSSSEAINTAHSDAADKKDARRLAIVLIALVAVLAGASLLLLPALGEIATTYLSPGLGLKEAAVLAFFATAILMIVFAVAAGDGFLGEIQFMLIGFLLFFVIIWLLLAWVF